MNELCEASLDDVIRRHIRLAGPVDIGTFMGLALSHPQYGYYINKDPLGKAGDFTTAPEISQMFGEMIGAWCADIWIKAGSPAAFILAECGPGRGTLMADIVRAAAAVPGFHAALSIHLIETSPALREKQAQALASFAPRFHDHLDDLPDDVPLIVVANEFLDALPVRQLQRTQDGWAERVIGLDDEGALSFGLASSLLVPPVEAAPGQIVEISPAREDFTVRLARRLRAQGGAALLIDYGHARTAPGDTLQAVKDHAYSDILENIGTSDLTSHVDFGRLVAVAAEQGAACYGPVEQGAFLQRLGIALRAAMLAQKANSAQSEAIQSALQRLTGSGAGQMGSLFKVLALCHDEALSPEGF